MGVCTTCNAEVDDDQMEAHAAMHGGEEAAPAEGAAEEMAAPAEEAAAPAEEAPAEGGEAPAATE